MSDPLRSLRRQWHRLRGTRIYEQDGVKLRSGEGDLPRTVRNLLYKGGYEAAERELLKRVVWPGSRVLEIGCGIGFVSLLCTRLAGEGNVRSFEANPVLEPVIRGNYALNGFEPDLVMKAVTANGDPIRFHRDDNILSSSSFDRGRETELITVPAEAFAQALAAHGSDVVVMDVEGAEVSLLHGSDLSGVRAMVVEMHPHIVPQADLDAMTAHVEAQGLRLSDRLQKSALFERAAA